MNKEYIWILKNNKSSQIEYFTTEEIALKHIKGVICHHNRIKKHKQIIITEDKNEIFRRTHQRSRKHQ